MNMTASCLRSSRTSLIIVLIVSLLLSSSVIAHAQSALSPYTLSVFATSQPPYSEPDDLAVSPDGKNLWVGFGNGVALDGSDGGSSDVVEYDIASGKVLRDISIPGHVDGLKIDPATGAVWTTENEDANPTLAIINPNNGRFRLFKFPEAAHGGGYDDLAFTGPRWQEVLLSCSSPANDPNSGPAIARIGRLSGRNAGPVTSVLAGDAQALDIPTQSMVTLNLRDPDSMTIDPFGDIILDSDIDHELIIVRPSGQTPNVLRLPVTLNNQSVEVNDTLFVTASSGTIYITDRDGQTIYALTKPYFFPNEVYVAADSNETVGLLDMNTGAITPVAIGIDNPEGLAFAPNPPLKSGRRS